SPLEKHFEQQPSFGMHREGGDDVRCDGPGDRRYPANVPRPVPAQNSDQSDRLAIPEVPRVHPRRPEPHRSSFPAAPPRRGRLAPTAALMPYLASARRRPTAGGIPRVSTASLQSPRKLTVILLDRP